MEIVEVKNLKLGEGITKICVPIVEKTEDDILEMTKEIVNLDVDIVEWRVDFFEKSDDLEEIRNVLIKIREILLDIPIIFTFRTSNEGGNKFIDAKDYISMNKFIAKSNLVDLIDIELFTENIDIREVVDFIHKSDTKVILSNHDFYKTPPKEEIIKRLISMQNLDADILKIAVMPNCKLDVLELLQATTIMNEKYAEKPLITMSMSADGIASRICGEIFGSCLTFAAMKNISAPGQIDVKEMKKIVNIIHNNL